MTTEDKPRRSYGFGICEDKFADCPSVVAHVLVREPKGNTGEWGEHPVNPRSEGEDEFWGATKRTHELALAGLKIRCWTNLDPRLGYFHGPDVRVENPYFVDLRMARRLLNTMTSVDKAITKANASEAGDVFMAVAKSIGATWYARRVGPDRGSFYSDVQWSFEPLETGREEFRRIVEKLKAMVPKREEAA